MVPVVLGIGTAVPRLRISRSESVDAATTLCAEDADQALVVEKLYRQAGVEARHLVHTHEEFRRVVYGEGDYDTPWIANGLGDKGPSTAKRMERYEREALPLAEHASLAALSSSGIPPSDLTHLITVSCTGFSAPGVDIGLIKRLGLPATVERTHVGFMGCHGALNGLRVARGLLAAEPRAKLLLCSVELCSVHYAYGWDPKKVVGNALFADGSAAVVVGEDTSPTGPAWGLAATGACLFPDSEQAMAWFVRDHGFEMVLSSKVPNLIERNLRPWLTTWLANQDLTIADVGSWAVHPGGPRVLNCVENSLGLTPEATAASRMILESHGNMSSSTVLFILDELMRRNAELTMRRMGFGPGLAAEVVLFR